MARQRKRNVSGDGAPNAAAALLKPKRPRECAGASQRTSVYRGVTRHRLTGRFEAHLWDKDTWSDSQSQRKKKKGRQVYLGAYGDEDAAARAYDLAALKYWGRETLLNFPLSIYDEEWREMEGQSREEYIGSLRRKSTGFSRGVSKYRGVARHHHNGKWEARIGRVFGNKYLYLGTYETQEEAAMAYDIAAIEHRGLNAVTNFDVSRYINWHRRSCSTEIAPGQLLGDPHPTIHLHQDDLGLLLHSPKFKDQLASLSSSSSSSSCSASPPPLPAVQQQQQPEYRGGASSARCSFPDDVQTYFGCDDDDGFDFAEVDTFSFGDLGAYAAPMFQFELDGSRL